MKSRVIVSLSLLLLSTLLVNSQVPDGFNYQALARNSSGEGIAATTLTVESSILSDTILDIYVWKEEHTVVTDPFGLFSLVVGQGTRTGGSSGSFDQINWSAGPLFIKTRINYQGNWIEMGEAKLWSVPYAMVSEISVAVLGNPVMVNGDAIYILGNVGIGTDTPGTTKLAVVGDDALSEDALFEVKREDGEVIFAVYNDGVRINVPIDPLAKGPRGGFAIGGFDKLKGVTEEYFMVSPDSIRAYVNNEAPVKGPRGGFAIGGFDKNKGITTDLFTVSNDSIRAYINQDPLLKGPRGGFAIGGFDKFKGANENYLSVTGQSTRIQVKDTIEGFSVANIFTGSPSDFMKVNKVNYFIGHESGIKNSAGVYNSFLGYESGRNNLDGSTNSFFGYQAGYNNLSGNGNLFLGYQSGYTNEVGSHNTFLGYRAGYLNKTGDKNTFLGSFAGENNSSGAGNLFSGIYSGRSNISGNQNVFLGPSTGEYNVSGDKNVFVGSNTGRNNDIGAQNVFIGVDAGYNNLDGGDNVFIGTESGFLNEGGIKNVFIGYQAGHDGTEAYGNVAIGHMSGLKLTLAYQNVFIGESSGKNTTWGESNVFIGNAAGLANITGSTNVLIGTGAGQKANANNNTFVGYGTGFEITSGRNNTYLGLQAGYSSKTGNYNVSVGNAAGYGNIGGSSNIFLGNYAGFSEPGSNKLYIDNSSTATPLIWGDFSLNKLSVNGSLGVGVVPSTFKVDVGGTMNLNRNITGSALYVNSAEALWYDGTYFSWGYGGTYNYFRDKITIGSSANPSYMLYVQGGAYATGGWSSISDIKFKEDIREIQDPLEKVLNMQGVSYNWKIEEYPDMGLPEGRHLGVIAQEVEEIIPECVNTDQNGEKSVIYNELIPVLIEAIKEQQETINQLKERIDRLEAGAIKQN